MFWVFAGLLIVSASVSGVLLERFTQSAVQADEIMLTAGKRVVQLDADVKRMAKLREELNGLNETNIVLNMQVTEALNNMRDYEKQAQVREESGIKRTQEILDRISNRLDVKFDKFAETVTSLEDKVKHNAIRLEKVGDELSELTISVNEMKDQQLVEKLDALIKLEQHRYYDMMSKSSNDKDLKKDDVEAVCVPRLGFPCP
jgi:chromosome segregation ATPase